jgi:DNA-binding response OmpR family regulator
LKDERQKRRARSLAEEQALYQVVLLPQLGAEGYKTKPFDPLELLARVRAAMRHFEPVHSPNEPDWERDEIAFSERLNKLMSSTRGDLTALWKAMYRQIYP